MSPTTLKHLSDLPCSTNQLHSLWMTHLLQVPNTYQGSSDFKSLSTASELQNGKGLRVSMSAAVGFSSATLQGLKKHAALNASNVGLWSLSNLALKYV